MRNHDLIDSKDSGSMSKRRFPTRKVMIGMLLTIVIHINSVSAVPPDSLDADIHRQVLIEIADVIREHYADPEVGRAIADTIMAHVEHGGAASSIDSQRFVAKVMGMIRIMVADRHFDLSDRHADKNDSKQSPDRSRSKHGLRTVKMLKDQTAYFEFDGFPGDEASLKAVTELIEEQPELHAVIFDLRDNNGGAGDMVVLLCNHLVESNRLLYTFAGRSDDTPKEVRSSPCERHFGADIPVYILTSEKTWSAAEAFTCILQDLGRAVIVGEQTAGMANPSRTYTIAERFDLTVPFLLIRYGESGGTFAGVGVTPDIKVPAETALDTALEKLGRIE